MTLPDRWLCVVAPAFTMLLAGCDRPAPSVVGPITVATIDSIEALGGLESQATLAESEDQPIGSIVDADVAADGTLYIADLAMSDVKVFDSAGRFRKRLGREGAGPGEYRGPAAVTISPDGSRIIVTDMGARRVVIFDARTDSALVTRQLVRSLLPRHATFGGADTIYVFGTDTRFGKGEIHEAVILRLGDSVETGFLDRAITLRPSGRAVNLVITSGVRTVNGLVALSSMYPVLRRFDHRGQPLDSLRLPPELFPPITIPDTGFTGSRGMMTYMRSIVQATRLRRLNDSTFAFQLLRHNSKLDEWEYRTVIVQWGQRSAKVMAARAYSPDQLVGAGLGYLWFVSGGPPDVYRVARLRVRAG